MDEARRRVLQVTIKEVAKILESSPDKNDVAFAALIFGSMGAWLAGDAQAMMHDSIKLWDKQLERIARINAAPNN